MKISFVIPAYNEEAMLPKCLESILAEIQRIHDSLGLGIHTEVVVVNNTSTDRTREIALRYRGVVVIDEPTKGPVWARKKGFENTSGELAAILDADIIMPKGWLTTVLKEFENNTNMVALTGPYIYYDLSGISKFSVKFFYGVGWLWQVFIRQVLRMGTNMHGGATIQGGNVVVRREALQEAGGFDTSIEFYGDDTDLAQRLSKVGVVKWTWKLPMLSSGRRLKAEGILTMSYKYTANYLWVTFLGRPLTTHYKDIRPK